MKEIFKSVDRHGIPIQIIYRRKPTYKTMAGACITMASMFGLFVYFVILCVQVYHRENYTVTSSKNIRNVYTDNTSIHMN
jgi:hypothetical protein